MYNMNRGGGGGIGGGGGSPYRHPYPPQTQSSDSPISPRHGSSGITSPYKASWADLSDPKTREMLFWQQKQLASRLSTSSNTSLDSGYGSASSTPQSIQLRSSVPMTKPSHTSTNSYFGASSAGTLAAYGAGYYGALSLAQAHTQMLENLKHIDRGSSAATLSPPDSAASRDSVLSRGNPHMTTSTPSYMHQPSSGSAHSRSFAQSQSSAQPTYFAPSDNAYKAPGKLGLSSPRFGRPFEMPPTTKSNILDRPYTDSSPSPAPAHCPSKITRTLSSSSSIGLSSSEDAPLDLTSGSKSTDETPLDLTLKKTEHTESFSTLPTPRPPPAHAHNYREPTRYPPMLQSVYNQAPGPTASAGSQRPKPAHEQPRKVLPPKPALLPIKDFESQMYSIKPPLGSKSAPINVDAVKTPPTSQPKQIMPKKELAAPIPGSAPAPTSPYDMYVPRVKDKLSYYRDYLNPRSADHVNKLKTTAPPPSLVAQPSQSYGPRHQLKLIPSSTVVRPDIPSDKGYGQVIRPPGVVPVSPVTVQGVFTAPYMMKDKIVPAPLVASASSNERKVIRTHTWEPEKVSPRYPSTQSYKTGPEGHQSQSTSHLNNKDSTNNSHKILTAEQPIQQHQQVFIEQVKQLYYQIRPKIPPTTSTVSTVKIDDTQVEPPRHATPTASFVTSATNTITSASTSGADTSPSLMRDSAVTSTASSGTPNSDNVVVVESSDKTVVKPISSEFTAWQHVGYKRVPIAKLTPIPVVSSQSGVIRLIDGDQHFQNTNGRLELQDQLLKSSNRKQKQGVELASGVSPNVTVAHARIETENKNSQDLHGSTPKGRLKAIRKSNFAASVRRKSKSGVSDAAGKEKGKEDSGDETETYDVHDAEGSPRKRKRRKKRVLKFTRVKKRNPKFIRGRRFLPLEQGTEDTENNIDETETGDGKKIKKRRKRKYEFVTDIATGKRKKHNDEKYKKRLRKKNEMGMFDKDAAYLEELHREQQRLDYKRVKRRSVYKTHPTGDGDQDTFQFESEHSDFIQDGEGIPEFLPPEEAAYLPQPEEAASLPEAEDKEVVPTTTTGEVKRQKRKYVRKIPLDQIKRYKDKKLKVKKSKKQADILDLNMGCEVIPGADVCHDSVDETNMFFNMHFEDDDSRASTPRSGLKAFKQVVSPEIKQMIVCREIGETKLHKTARLGHLEQVQKILDYGLVDVNARENAGYTALHKTCVRGHLNVARCLISNGAKVTAQALDGTQPIHDAVDNNHIEIVRLLLACGADPSVANYGGRAAIKLARTDAMKMLLKGYMEDIKGPTDDQDEVPIIYDPPQYVTGTSKHLGFNGMECVPQDEDDMGDIMMTFTEIQHIPTYYLNLEQDCGYQNYYLFSEVLSRLDCSEDVFLLDHPDVSLIKAPKADITTSVGRFSHFDNATLLRKLFGSDDNDTREPYDSIFCIDDNEDSVNDKNRDVNNKHKDMNVNKFQCDNVNMAGIATASDTNVHDKHGYTNLQLGAHNKIEELSDTTHVKDTNNCESSNSEPERKATNDMKDKPESCSSEDIKIKSCNSANNCDKSNEDIHADRIDNADDDDCDYDVESYMLCQKCGEIAPGDPDKHKCPEILFGRSESGLRVNTCDRTMNGELVAKSKPVRNDEDLTVFIRVCESIDEILYPDMEMMTRGELDSMM